MHAIDLHMDRPKELPDRDYWQMVEMSNELRRQEAGKAREYEDGVKKSRQEYLKQFQSIVTHDGNQTTDWSNYTELRRKQIAEMRAARQRLSGNAAGKKEVEHWRHELAQNFEQYAAKHRIDVAQIRSLRSDVKKANATLFDATVGKGIIVPPEERKKPKNHTFFPPFNGSTASVFATRFAGDSSDNLPAPTFNFWADFTTGEVGSASFVFLSDASDYDHAIVRIRTSVRKWFLMPKEGQLVVSNLLEVIDDNVSWGIVNEWGQSDIKLKHDVSFCAQVTSSNLKDLSPIVKVKAISNQLIDEDTNPDDHSENISRGATGEFDGIQMLGNHTLTVPGVHNANTWVAVDIGVETTQEFQSNDVTLFSTQIAHFWTKHIGISTT
jgi:hypothetical protein